MCLLIHLAVALGAVFCVTDEDTALQVIKVDNQHLQMEGASISKAEVYRISACTKVVLDATGYRFDVPADLRNQPVNTIQVVQDKTHQFDVAWEPRKTRCELSAATLRPRRGSKPFDGFKARDQVIVGIGVLTPPKQLNVVWVGIVQVQ